MGSDDDDRDQLDAGPGAREAPGGGLAASVALPTQEPEISAERQRQDLKGTIEELESALAYMGSVHPERARTEQRLVQLKLALAASSEPPQP